MERIIVLRQLEEMGYEGRAEGIEEEKEGASEGLPEELVEEIVNNKKELIASRKERRKNKEIIEMYATQEVDSVYFEMKCV